MNLFRMDLEWDSISVMQAVVKAMNENGFRSLENEEIFPELCFSDDGRNGFAIHGYKGEYALRVILQNQEKRVAISTGMLKAKKVNDIVTKFFGQTELAKASQHLEELLKK